MRLIRDSRLQELACEAKMGVVQCGMASVVPLQLINILTAQDLDLRVCGLPDINLEYLKVRMCGYCHSASLDVVNAGLSGVVRWSWLMVASSLETHNVSSWFDGDRQTRPVLLECTGKLLTGKPSSCSAGLNCHFTLSPFISRMSCASSSSLLATKSGFRLAIHVGREIAICMYRPIP